MPWTHVPNQVPLDEGAVASAAEPKGSPAVQAFGEYLPQAKIG